jgi:hypothetical protein
MFHYMAGAATRLRGATMTPSVPYMPGTEFHAYTRREPVGVVGAITPWNYPLHQIAAKVAYAIAAGCTVVLKPSEVAPLDALILAEVIDEVGLPAGVFNLVTGTGPVVGEAIAAHPAVAVGEQQQAREGGDPAGDLGIARHERLEKRLEREDFVAQSHEFLRDAKLLQHSALRLIPEQAQAAEQQIIMKPEFFRRGRSGTDA